MTQGKHQGRKTNRVVRMPATRFPHLQKRLKKLLVPRTKGGGRKTV